MSEVITSDAVELEIPTASFGIRLLGGIIDVFAIFAAFALVMMFMNIVEPPSDLGPAFSIIVLVGVFVGTPAFVETVTRGRSLGKLALGIRIVRDDAGPIRFRHALIRALTGMLEIWFTFGSIAVVTSLFNARGKRLGDFLAGTHAVHVRGLRPLPPVPMPPELAAWAASCDIRRMPDGLGIKTKQYLSRLRDLNPHSRMQLGVSLATAVEEYVKPPPPAGTPPERFLAAVLAERRNREYAIGIKDQYRLKQEQAVIAHLPFAVIDPPVI